MTEDQVVDGRQPTVWIRERGEYLLCELENRSLCAWIRERIAPVRLLRAIAVRAGETISEADAHQETADYLMLDSGAKGLPVLGASGETHDWSVARTVVERSRIPVILAGGLSADNVAQAIAAVRPWGVDSFTHTDVPGNRGKKDPPRVRAFIAAALRGFADMIESPERR